ncbi:MAG: hypothetical protein HY961_20875 [Ignavibacteriae bacterium]|nr:hypothetical protein [Ignavibacteriota bacterium]
MSLLRPLIPLVLIAVLFARAFGGDQEFNGKWTLLPLKSPDIDLFKTSSVDISQNGLTVTIIHTWGSGRTFTDKLVLKTGDTINRIPVENRVWPSNVFMGISMDTSARQEVTALWEINGTRLKVERRYTVLASQGKEQITSTDTYELTDEKQTLTVILDRPTRKSGAPLKYVFKRAGTKEAYVMSLADTWDVDGKLSENVLLLSVQGLANTDAPRLYFLYPDTWDFRFTPAMLDFYKTKLNYTFTELKSSEQALTTFKQYAKGYVVWDRNVRTSLDVAFTIAGLERGVVVSEDLIPMVEKAGLKQLEDLRGKFTGQTDAQIFRWAYDTYGSKCNNEYIVWLGGESGKVMKPGIADFAIAKHTFVTDLSTLPTDTIEYKLADEILSKQKSFSMVMGWHSYAKDKERDYVRLTSHYALRVEGLHTMPNLSFTSMTPPSPGFKFKNNHNVVPGKEYKPEKKVYVTCIQSDGLGLGAWTKPGRGTMPYAWEVTINWLWMAPAMLEYYYSAASPNDFFIGALSGPGYMYPKAIPRKLLPGVIAKADELMKKLDINVFETMDYSEGATLEGNTELPKYVVDAYYDGMPDAIGFVNGYVPAYTFTSRNGRPFISYDYYLSETRPEADAVIDLQELASINKDRPYFLLVHVREWSDIVRVKGIMDKLGAGFEVVPLDVFLKMAGESPTFKERYLYK